MAIAITISDSDGDCHLNTMTATLRPSVDLLGVFPAQTPPQACLQPWTTVRTPPLCRTAHPLPPLPAGEPRQQAVPTPLSPNLAHALGLRVPHRSRARTTASDRSRPRRSKRAAVSMQWRLLQVRTPERPKVTAVAPRGRKHPAGTTGCHHLPPAQPARRSPEIDSWSGYCTGDAGHVGCRGGLLVGRVLPHPAAPQAAPGTP
mmetsp:Transcript_3180/g.9216  ORF Transcript_3180/g.9216 Transcript_3180/m.9216 type:complete len:203 (+) Transcript_3180:593-1201(+)